MFEYVWENKLVLSQFFSREKVKKKDSDLKSQVQKTLSALLLRVFDMNSTTSREFGIPQNTFVKILDNLS